MADAEAATATANDGVTPPADQGLTLTAEQDKLTSATPPSYNSLYERLKTSRQQSNSNAGFLKSLPAILAGTVGCSICLGIFLAIPISMIVIGALYLDDCPAQRYIPIYLVVGGCFAVLGNLGGLIRQVCQTRDPEKEATVLSRVCNISGGCVGCFILAWFIAGNVWIYSTYNNFTTEQGDPNYCHPTLYWYAFWLTTAGYILLGFVFVGVCVITCCALCCAAICCKDINE